MKKNQLLIIQSQTFGYLTDSLKWCEYIKDKYEVTVICQNTKKKKLITDGIKVKYLKSFGNRQMRGLLFVTQCIFKIALFSGKIMVIYFEHCEIFKSIFPWKKMLLDIRTMSVSQNEQRRRIYNKGIINACKKFDIITAISQGVKKQINLPDKPIYILPLGADHISVRKKDYDQLHLLYVGTFAGRDIDKTIDAISIFKKTHPEIPITYDIIGSGFNNEIEQFNQKIKALNLGEIITLHGRIPSNRLKPYFDKCNIGLSFIPLTEYYDNQPPTKTFEYALSGLFTIATSTKANKEIISPTNGILISDTQEDLANAIYAVWQMRHSLNYEQIINSLDNFKWSNIVNETLIPILKKY